MKRIPKNPVFISVCPQNCGVKLIVAGFALMACSPLVLAESASSAEAAPLHPSAAGWTWMSPGFWHLPALPVDSENPEEVRLLLPASDTITAFAFTFEGSGVAVLFDDVFAVDLLPTDEGVFATFFSATFTGSLFIPSDGGMPTRVVLDFAGRLIGIDDQFAPLPTDFFASFASFSGQAVLFERLEGNFPSLQDFAVYSKSQDREPYPFAPVAGGNLESVSTDRSTPYRLDPSFPVPVPSFLPPPHPYLGMDAQRRLLEAPGVPRTDTGGTLHGRRGLLRLLPDNADRRVESDPKEPR